MSEKTVVFARCALVELRFGARPAPVILAAKNFRWRNGAAASDRAEWDRGEKPQLPTTSEVMPFVFFSRRPSST